MIRNPPDTPFTVYLTEPPVCGVSDRLQRRINAQFALVAVVVGVVIAGAVWAVRILR